MNHPRSSTTTATLAFAIAAAAVLLGCSGGDSGIVGCADSTVCAIAAGGQCLPAPVGFDVCAYPATECPSGLAWSPEAGTLAGTCVAAAIDARIPTCGELGCSAIGTFCQPDGSCTCTPPGGSETSCTESRDAGSGPDAGDSGTDASGDGRIPTCVELGCSPIGVFCQPDGSCVCTPPGGAETPCTR